MNLSRRLLPLIVVTLVLLALVMLMSPQQLPVLGAKVLHVTLAAVVAFWIDVLFFPYARIDGYLVNPDYQHSAARTNDANNPIVMGYRLVFAACMLRRALIVGAAMIAIGLGA